MLLRLLAQHLGFGQGVGVFEFAIGAGPEGGVYAIEQGRVDDSEDAIRHRQEVYQRETAPLLDMFREQGLLIEVDGLGAVDEVTQRIFTALAERGLGIAAA